MAFVNPVVLVCVPFVNWSRSVYIFSFVDSTRYDILQESTRSGIKSTLLIHDANSKDFGMYNCTAKNGYGKDIGEIQLNRQRKSFCLIQVS